MSKDLFANLPSEIIILILSKLPVRSIICCKCVRKSWLALLKTPEFINFHLLNATPGLAIYGYKSRSYEVFEFEDLIDLERHDPHYRSVIKFKFAEYGWIDGSFDGLLLLSRFSNFRSFCICNPITRECIEPGLPVEIVTTFGSFTCGFGASRISHQYKVVRIFQECDKDPSRMNFVCVCHVYTIGTGLWRRLSPVPNLQFDYYSTCTVLNGNLHWLTLDLNGSQLWISCFDLETELFSTFSPPISGRLADSTGITAGLSTFEDCLCICDCNSADGFAIWVMKEYGDEKSWSKQILICSRVDVEPFDHVQHINVFKDGEILMIWDFNIPSYYSKRSKIVQKLRMFEPFGHIDAFSYTPSFLSLKSFGLENIASL